MFQSSKVIFRHIVEYIKAANKNWWRTVRLSFYALPYDFINYFLYAHSVDINNLFIQEELNIFNVLKLDNILTLWTSWIWLAKHYIMLNGLQILNIMLNHTSFFNLFPYTVYKIVIVL